MCGARDVPMLILLRQEGISPESSQDYEHAAIYACETCGVALIEHFVIDRFEPDGEHVWFVLDPADAARMLALVGACPRRFSADCGCALHAALAEAVDELPVVSWRWACVGDRHAHPATLVISDGRLAIVADEVPFGDRSLRPPGANPITQPDP
jgi:hypothetical protein